MSLTESDEGWSLPLAGLQVTRCIVDLAFSIEFLANTDSASLTRIGTAFELTVDDGRRSAINPANPSEVGAALTLFGMTVSCANARRDGSLEISFREGMRVCVPANDAYEAWEAVLAGGARLVSQPGGHVAVWTVDPSSG